MRANEERLAFLLKLNDTPGPLSDPAAVLENCVTAAGRTPRRHPGGLRRARRR